MEISFYIPPVIFVPIGVCLFVVGLLILIYAIDNLS